MKKVLLVACLVIAAWALALPFLMPPQEASLPIAPTAPPASPIQVPEAVLDRTFGVHPPLDPTRCVEDEYRVDAFADLEGDADPDLMTFCLHIEGDGWRTIDPAP